MKAPSEPQTIQRRIVHVPGSELRPNFGAREREGMKGGREREGQGLNPVRLRTASAGSYAAAARSIRRQE